MPFLVEASLLEPSAVAGEDGERFSLVAEPSTIVLGRTSSVKLEIEATGGGEDEPPLRATVNVGSLGEIETLEPGRYHVEYSPPSKRFPQVAVVALWRETGPGATVAFFRLPLLGTARVPIQTAPGAEVTVRVAGRSFGPLKAAEDGRVAARLIVPPGVRRAMVSAVGDDGDETSQEMSLDVPPYNRLTLASVPHAVTADGVSLVRLHLFYDATGRRMPSPDAFRIETDLEDAGPVQHITGPLFLGEFTAPAGMQDGEAEIVARVRRDRASTASASVTVGRQSVEHLLVEPLEGSVVADGLSPLKLTVWARDALGLGVGGARPKAEVDPPEAVQSIHVEDAGEGRYTVEILPARIDPPENARAVTARLSCEEASAEVSLELAPWEPARIEVEPTDLELVADGIATTSMTLRALDREGRAMPHIQPEASAALGEVASVTAVEDDGSFLLRYVAPKREYGASRDEPPPTAHETITIEAGGVEEQVSLVLTEVPGRHWSPELFVEAGVGVRTNLGALAGPELVANAGLRIARVGPAEVRGGLWTGLSHQTGSLEPLGSADQGAEVRISTVPLMASASAYVPLDEWSFGAGVGAGLMLAPGTVSLAGSDDVHIDSVARAMGARLSIERRAGPGKFVSSMALVSSSIRHGRDDLDVSGQVGGLGVTIGYGLDL